MSRDSKSVVFVAGATGAIGRVLCRLLVDAGFPVFGTSRHAARRPLLESLGVQPVIVDVYDRPALAAAVSMARPEVVIHQLTDLPPGLAPELMAEARVRNARIRDEGTRHLIAASVQCGVRRLIAQSIAFMYAGDSHPYREETPLSSESLAAFEQQVLDAPLTGIVLRYGRLYGPGTGFDAPSGGSPVHVDAAADAARRAVTRGRRGIYNIAEDDGVVSTGKAMSDLDWRSDFRAAGR